MIRASSPFTARLPSAGCSPGKLAGITEDAVDEHGIEIDDDTALVGTVMEPNLESVAALSRIT